MEKERLSAFTDGVLAVVITIMVLELKPPHEPTWDSLLGQWPIFAAYVLSFVYIAIYWNNHHHMLHLIKYVDGKAMWYTMLLLFWLSLVPFTTGWLSETQPFPLPLPTFLYAFVLTMAGVSWIPLEKALIARNGGKDSKLANALKSHTKERISISCYVIAMVLAWVVPAVSLLLITTVAIIWFVPDKRVENALFSSKNPE